MMELPDEISPEEAQKRYDEYLNTFWGSAIKDKKE